MLSESKLGRVCDSVRCATASLAFTVIVALQNL